jgi:hypothetical protein
VLCFLVPFIDSIFLSSGQQLAVEDMHMWHATTGGLRIVFIAVKLRSCIDLCPPAFVCQFHPFHPSCCIHLISHQ